MAIISFAHNFIFIKTVKTAGTSIEVDLSRAVEPEAVVTQILPPYPNHTPRNHLDEAGNHEFVGHMSAVQIRDRIGADTFDGMYRFCVEREPVAKCISHYHMRRNSTLHNPDGAYERSWDQYCRAGSFPIDIDKYSEIQDGKRVMLVNAVLDYDKLSTQLPSLLQTLGIKFFLLTANAKSEYSQNHLVTPDMVTTSQRTRIYDAFQETLLLTKSGK